MSKPQTTTVLQRLGNVLPVFIVVGFCLPLAGCGENYAAEVGYRAGTETRWDIWGDFTSLEECQNAAIARYNFYFADNRRAVSWSCLKKNGSGGYASRHR